MVVKTGLDLAAEWHEEEAKRIAQEMDVSRLDPDGNYLGGSPETSALIRIKEHQKSAEQLRLMSGNVE